MRGHKDKRCYRLLARGEGKVRALTRRHRVGLIREVSLLFVRSWPDSLPEQVDIGETSTHALDSCRNLMWWFCPRRAVIKLEINCSWVWAVARWDFTLGESGSFCEVGVSQSSFRLKTSFKLACANNEIILSPLKIDLQTRITFKYTNDYVQWKLSYEIIGNK